MLLVYFSSLLFFSRGETKASTKYIWLHVSINYLFLQKQYVQVPQWLKLHSHRMLLQDRKWSLLVPLQTVTIITWAFSKNVKSVSSSEMMLPGGGKRSIRRITASVEQNQTAITCVVFGGTTETYTALLLVQGN